MSDAHQIAYLALIDMDQWIFTHKSCNVMSLSPSAQILLSLLKDLFSWRHRNMNTKITSLIATNSDVNEDLFMN